MRLVCPATGDERTIGRCADVLSVANRSKATTWAGHAEAMAGAHAEVFGEEPVERLRAKIEAEPLPEPERMKRYIAQGASWSSAARPDFACCWPRA